MTQKGPRGQNKPTPKDVLTAYDDAYRKVFEGTPAPIVGAKDAKLASDLLKRYELSDLRRWIGLFFHMPDGFIQQSGYTFGVFSSCLGKVIAFEARTQGRGPRPVSGRTARILAAAARARKTS